VIPAKVADQILDVPVTRLESLRGQEKKQEASKAIACGFDRIETMPEAAENRVLYTAYAEHMRIAVALG
jgi:hypothetical protein